MIVADLKAEGPFTQAARLDEVSGEWLAHASGKRAYLEAIHRAGFKDVAILAETTFPMAEADERLRGKIVSIAVQACKG